MTTLPADSNPLGRATERPPRLTYSVEEVAAVLGLSRSKTYELVARGLGAGGRGLEVLNHVPRRARAERR